MGGVGDGIEDCQRGGTISITVSVAEAGDILTIFFIISIIASS